MASVTLAIFGALVGAVLGSTMSALAYRIPAGMNIAVARSECPSCHVQIAASYIVLEGSMALLYAVLVPLYRWGITEVGIYLAVFIAVTGAIVDLKVRKIPNVLTYFGMLAEALLVVGRSIESHSLAPILPALIALIIFGGSLFVIGILTKGMGLGDAKLVGVIALALSSFGLYFIFYVILGSFALGSLVGVALMVTGRASRKSAIPFGPFITLSFLIALLVAKL